MAEFSFVPLVPPAPAPELQDLDALLDEARAEADAIRAAAHAEGLAAGRAQALEAVVPAVAALEAAVADVRARGDAVAERLEGEAVDLAFAVAEKILAAAVAAEPETVLEAIRGALRGIVERERVTLLVNPADLELVRAAAAELRASLGGIDHCEVQAERRVGPGGAVVRYADGQVDARMETKLERAREVVAAALVPAIP
ncbi:MAG TPA: FliH/SctL family protein [Solirubrobacteraceae bacterium]